MAGGRVSEHLDPSLGQLRPGQGAEVQTRSRSPAPSGCSGDNGTLACSSSALSATREFLGSKPSQDHVRKSGFQQSDSTLGGHPSVLSRTTAGPAGLTSALGSHRTGWTAGLSVHTPEEAHAKKPYATVHWEDWNQEGVH